MDTLTLCFLLLLLAYSFTDTLTEICCGSHGSRDHTVITDAALPGTSKNAEAAAVSLPSQLRRETAVDRDRWVWRTALERSQPFWCVPACSAAYRAHVAQDSPASAFPLLHPFCCPCSKGFVLIFPQRLILCHLSSSVPRYVSSCKPPVRC